MSFASIPIRQNGFDHLIEASWFNTIRTELINAFGTGGYIKVADEQVLDNGDTIVLDVNAFKPLIPIKSLGGARTLSITPFTVGHGVTSGKEIILLGTSDTDYMVIDLDESDATDEAIASNGLVEIKKYVQLHLIYNSILKRFIRLE